MSVSFIFFIIFIVGFIAIKRISFHYENSLLIELPFDVPATIGTYLDEHDYTRVDYYYKVEITTHERFEYAKLIFEKGHQFINKIDGKTYDFPFEQFKHLKDLDVISFSKYGYGAKIICRYNITLNKKTGEIVDCQLSAIKPVTYGDRNYELIEDMGDERLALHRVWRKTGYPDNHIISQYEINEYDKILSKEDGLSYYREEPTQEEEDRFNFMMMRDSIICHDWDEVKWMMSDEANED